MKIVTRSWECHFDNDRPFKVGFHFMGWGSIQLGFHIDLTMKNFEIHLPFCFIHVGLVNHYKRMKQVGGK